MGLGSEAEFVKNVTYSEAYWVREDGISFKGHLGIWNKFSQAKVRLRTRTEIDGFINLVLRPN